MRQPERSTPVAFFLTAILFVTCTLYADAPATAPTDVKTGEIDLTFTQRSPLSTRKELARRLNLKEAELGDDYDLSTRPFKAYVPPGYAPAVPHGVFVYLGYKDSVSVASLWEPILDKSHLIFVTPVCHHGDHYQPDVPLWQVMGLAFDAVENLKHLYNVDTRRIYLMSFHEGSMPMSLGAADVFTGFLVTFNNDYYRKMIGANRGFFPVAFPPPPVSLLQQAKRRPFALLEPDFSDPNQTPHVILLSMKSDGFNVMSQVADTEEVHYPNLKPEWFEQNVLPFLDKSVLSAPVPRPVATSPAAKPAGAGAAASLEGNPEPARLLRIAKLYIQNGQPKMARPKLETILSSYPKDPAAVVAKQLLADLPAPEN